ncbi:hypothetical protein [Nisaea sediminum]|uniref:hypothetical protein n=1 Tax=Nisaea sediminum TaxID=2775867 RepID=UPI001867931A|nr:hypothetical protein [Nisaea sediminum]
MKRNTGNRVSDSTKQAILAGYGRLRNASAVAKIYGVDRQTVERIVGAKGTKSPHKEKKREDSSAADRDTGRNPLSRAVAVIGNRVAKGKDGGPTLDGRPSSARLIVEAANAVLAQRKQPLISYPGVRT